MAGYLDLLEAIATPNSYKSAKREQVSCAHAGGDTLIMNFQSSVLHKWAIDDLDKTENTLAEIWQRLDEGEFYRFKDVALCFRLEETIKIFLDDLHRPVYRPS